MFKLLRNYISQRIADFKGGLKLAIVYPKQFKDASVKSLLPHKVENLIKEGVSIGKNVSISDHLQKLGKGVYIGWSTEITQCSEIGAFSSISNGVKIGLNSHPLDHIGTSAIFFASRRGWSKKDTYDEHAGNFVKIGADVLISANVIVLKGVSIGTGAVIGAGAVVTKDIPPYSIAVGVPAKVTKLRFDEATIERLMRSEWWNLPAEKIKSLESLFTNPDEFLKKIGH